MSLSHPLRFATAALALLALTSCGDPVAPSPTTTQDIEVTNVFAPASGANRARATFAETEISITKIRLTVYGVPSGTNLFQEVYTVDPTAAKWTLKFTAPIGESIRIVAELISVTSGQEKVEYSGQAGPLTLAPCITACTPIPVKTYPGTADNLTAESVTITPDGASIIEGETTTFTATVSPVGPAYAIAWKSIDPNVATVSSSGVVTGVAAGTARIVAAVASRADTVTVTVTPANTCAETPYTIGSTVNASWATTDCTFTASGRRYDMYAITLAQQATFTAQVTGANGRRIQVRRANTTDYVQVMASAEFMPPTANPLQVGYVLPAGSYVMEVVAPDGATLGNYSLATTTTLPQGCSTLVYVWPGVTINGTISNSDCAWPTGPGHEDRYVVLPDAGVRLAAGLTTSAFPATVALFDTENGALPVELVADRERDIGAPAKIAYTTTYGGYHSIVVSHNAETGSGAYTLTIGTESATNTCTAINTDYGSRRAKWEATDCAGDGGYVYDKYTFTTDEQTAFRLQLSSTAANKTAGVFLNGKEILDWAGSGTGDLNAAWLLAAGTYEVRLGAPAASAGTSYTYSATEPTQIECTNNGAMGGVSFTGLTLATTDCSFNGAYEDRLVLYVEQGKTIEVTMNGTSVAPRAIIRDPLSTPGTVLSMDTRATTGSVTVTYTTTVTGYYQVIFSSNAAGQTGSYNGSIIVR